jgi:hypothetical protein
MQPKPLLQRFGILVALLTLGAALFGGINTAAAQEPEVAGTPSAEAIEIPAEGVTTLPPEDCTFTITNEMIPTTAEPASGDNGTSVTIEITVNVDNNGQVSVNSGGKDTAIPADPAAAWFDVTDITNGTVPDLALVEAGCSSSAVEYPDASPTDSNTGGGAQATPFTTEPAPADPEANCTVVKETKLADGTTEKTFSCPAT